MIFVFFIFTLFFQKKATGFPCKSKNEKNTKKGPTENHIGFHKKHEKQQKNATGFP